MTTWRWGLVAWTIVVIIVMAASGRESVLSTLLVWFVGLLVLGGVRAALGSAFRR